MDTVRCAAIDLGAESCRVSLGEWDGRTAKVALLHRYPNAPVECKGHLYWPLEQLCEGARSGLRLCAESASATKGVIHSVGVDGWAVDYVRLDAAGKPLGDPFCYRDARTETAMPEVWEYISKERLYELTGIQFLRFNTLYQLYADRRDRLAPPTHWLNIPEYLLHWLCGLAAGTAVAEYTNATHTQIVDAATRTWCNEIFEKVGLDRSAVAPIVAPGTPLGPLQAGFSSLPACAGTKMIAPACHDTGSAVAGIPEMSSDCAFIISGTWSLVGTVMDQPCTSASALRENFTNEGGIGGTIRFLKNVNGMWLLEESLRKWHAEGGRKWTLPELVAECARKPVARTVFNVDAPELILPGHMPWKINCELEKAGHAPLLQDAGHAPEMANVIFASLAARYAVVLKSLQEVTGRKFRRVFVVGGGSQNEYLNRLIAQRTGLEVQRGPVESSTIGNLAVQFASLESGGSAPGPADVARWAARLNAS
jgi:rhamnulokinase